MNIEQVLSLLFKKQSNITISSNSSNVLIVGGSYDDYTAPIFAGLAAKKTGVNKVTLFIPRRYQKVSKNHSSHFSIHFMLFDEIGLYDVNTIHKLVEESDILLIGNGIGKGFDVKKTVLSILCGIKNKPVIINSQAIFPELLSIYKPHEHNWLIFSHITELKQLIHSDCYNLNLDDDQLLLQWSYDHKIALCLKTDTYKIIDNRKNKIIHNMINYSSISIKEIDDALTGIIASYAVMNKIDLIEAAHIATSLLST